MTIQYVIASIIISFGAFFLFIGSLGLIRLPDFYSRTHATGKADTLGIFLILLGLIIVEGLTINSAKLAIIFVFVGLTNPTATNALSKAAFRFRLKPWFKNSGKAGGSKTKDSKK